MLRPYVFPCRFSGRMTDLKRSLRLTDGLAMVVGMTVGAGIFRTPGIVAARLGRPGLTFVVWVLGAGLAFLGALCFAELTTRQPRAAGKYAFVREAFGTRAGFVVGWVEALGTNGVAIAAIGVAGGEFLVRLLGWPPARIAPLGAGLVALFTGINLVGVASGRWVQNVVTAAKLLALGGVVVIAFARGTGAGWHGALPGAPVGLGVWVAIALAAHPVIWTYYGYPDLAKIAGEVVDPSRTLPRILLGGLAATAVLYLALNAAFLQVLPLERIAASNLVAADVMDTLVGARGVPCAEARRAGAVRRAGLSVAAAPVRRRVRGAVRGDGASATQARRRSVGHAGGGVCTELDRENRSGGTGRGVIRGLKPRLGPTCALKGALPAEPAL